MDKKIEYEKLIGMATPGNVDEPVHVELAEMLAGEMRDMESPFYSIKENETDSENRKAMKKNAGWFMLASFAYALFYVWPLGNSRGGLMALVFSALTIGYFFGAVKWMGFELKKWHLVFPVATFLLGISQILTNSEEIHGFNGLVGFCLVGIFLLVVCYETKTWGFGRFISKGIASMFGGFIHMECIADVVLLFQGKDVDNEVRAKRRKTIASILLGLVIGVPVTFIMFWMLRHSDVIFASKSQRLLEISFSGEVFVYAIEALFIGGYLYCAMGNLAMDKKQEIKKERKQLDAVVAITIYAMLTVLYVMFSVVQFAGLVLKELELPEGYTYAEYAREGYFSLLAVCGLNIVFVVFGKLYFKRHTVLQVLLNIICGCTVMMIAASALKMYMYISAYGLTRLRYKVVISLVVESLVIVGTILWINMKKFPLLPSTAAVFLVAYLFYSLSMPDYQIVRYNLEHVEEIGFYSAVRLSETSYDAVPAMVEYLESAKGNPEKEKICELVEAHLDYYRDDVAKDYRCMQWQDTNFSLIRAAKLLGVD